MLIVAHPRDERFLARMPFEVKVAPELIELDRVLEDAKLVLMASNDLLRSAPQAAWNGRPSTPVVVTLRAAVLRRLMNWGYRTLESELQGNVIWRWLCRIDGGEVPDHSTFQEREKWIRPATQQRLNARVVHIAQEKGVTRGRKMRADSTVMETDIHYPTDSRLLCDSVEVLGRLLSRARGLCRPRSRSSKALFRNSSRRARRLAFQISNRLRGRNGQKKPEKVAEKPYRQLLQLTQATLVQTQEVVAWLQRKDTAPAQKLARSLQHYLPLVQQVIDQTTRRVFQHDAVPATEKIVSLFEPHTAIIRRGKPAPHDTEFGRKLWLVEVDGGLISEYRLLKGNPPDARQWKQSLKHHRRLFGHPPQLASADRGIFSPDNETSAYAEGIEHVALPQPGAKTPARRAYEAQPWFKAALRFRAGIEGRISGLKRARGLDRCLNHGEPGLQRWLGWGVIANNLIILATKLARRRRSAQAVA